MLSCAAFQLFQVGSSFEPAFKVMQLSRCLCQVHEMQLSAAKAEINEQLKSAHLPLHCSNRGEDLIYSSDFMTKLMKNISI